MAAIDVEKNVSKHIAENNGHKLTRFCNMGYKGYEARCKLCDMIFLIPKEGRKRCASNVDIKCPGVGLTK